MISLSYFAWVRDAMGTGGEHVERAHDWHSVADLIDYLAARDERGARAFADRSRIRAAIGTAMVPLDAPLADGADLSLFPPVTGG